MAVYMMFYLSICMCYICIVIYLLTYRWFGLVSLFNGMSVSRKTVVVLFNPHLGGGSEIHAFLKDISWKVKVITQVEFELAYYDVTVQPINLDSTGDSTLFKCLIYMYVLCMCICMQVCVIQSVYVFKNVCTVLQTTSSVRIELM